ncbi:exopolysaccharide production repressor protein [Aliirhizobium smilacinae]|nr:exopolysaccharide production repressor protein [Rhizobium smilacinae]
MMYAPRVFVSMIGTLAVFAIAAYVMSGSFWMALGETILCAVILQIGYFIGIVYLVRREKAQMDSARSSDGVTAKSRADAGVRDNLTAEAPARVHIQDH